MENSTVLETCVNNLTSDKLVNVSKIIWLVFGSLAMIIGIPGHIFQIIISTNKITRKQPASLYFVAMAIVELLFLLGMFWLWCVNLSLIKMDPREVLGCGGFYSILVGSTILSNLYLASASIDNSMMILHPAQYRLIVTRSRVLSRIILITCIVILLLIPHHFYLHYNSNATIFLCDFHPSLKYQQIRLWALIHAVLFVSVPSLIVCIGASILLHNRCKHKRMQKNNLSVIARRIHRRAIFIFFFSLWLLLSLVPMCILEAFMMHERFFHRYKQCSIRWKTYKILLHCFLILLSINYSTKFYAHLIVSTAARKHFKQLFTCTSDHRSSISMKMDEKSNNEQHLLQSTNQTKAKPMEI